jgi:hypothetical protein
MQKLVAKIKKILATKNHLGRFCTKGKQLLENYLPHNFVQFWSQELVMT